MFENLLDPVMRPLLSMSPFWAIFLIALLITLVITLVYKYATDQEHMKRLKEKVKQHQERLKKLRDNPEKMMREQQKMMKVNMELMKHSFKPTLYTFLPIIIVFGWLNAHMAYYNLAPNQPFTLSAHLAPGVSDANLTIVPEGVTIENVTKSDGTVTWTLVAPAGEYKAVIDAGGAQVEKRILVTDERRYEPPVEQYKNEPVTSVLLSNEEVKPLGSLSLFGWHPGWLGTYILLSIILSILLRKALGVV